MRQLFAALAFAALTALALPAAAQEAPRLDAATKAHLVAATKLRDGGTNLDTLGSKPTLVVFFASWCGSCARQFQELAHYFDEDGRDAVDVVGVNWLEEMAGTDEARMARMLARIDPGVAVLSGNADIDRAFGEVGSVTGVYLFDAEGKLVLQVGGMLGPSGRHFLPRDRLRAMLAKMAGAA